MRFNNISFLSDYGLADEFVGVVHSVVRSLAPEVRVIDISHNVAAHDVRAGGLALARAVPYMASGVVLGVVDPGVGTTRRPVAIEVADGQAYLVGPDNGLLAPSVALVGGATGAVMLDRPEYHLGGEAADPNDPPSTFDGRDIFAPVAAHLCLGVPLEELGTPVDPIQLMPGLLPVSDFQDDGSLRAEVLWVDRFGNAQLNVDPAEIADWPEFVSIEGGRTPRSAQRVQSFAAIPTGGVGLIVDSAGLLAIAIDQGSAAADLQIHEGTEITLRPSDGRAPASPVTLGPTRSRPNEQTDG